MNNKILAKYGIKERFPSAVISEAVRVSPVVRAEDCRSRTDFSDDLIITIDGEDAKDLDDAVSVKLNEDGTYSLAVHIADVSHYVREGSALDREAKVRATSVYFPDGVVPMLPKELSNGICSLSGGVDRLTLSVVMKINSRGHVLSYEFHEGIINTRARMTYDEVAVLLGDKLVEADAIAALQRQYAVILPMLRLMRELALILEASQAARGSIDFDIPEAKILTDKGGRVVAVERAERNAAHKLIEQFMIIANETVAAHLQSKKAPCIYRIHEKPSLEKMQDFAEFLGFLGLKLTDKIENIRPKAFQNLLKEAKGTPQETILRRVMLRSMQKAIYSEKNEGHFGLASRCYCHFTSPIRRYPDLFVHRVIKADIAGELTEKARLRFKLRAIDAAASSSVKERQAEEAERDVDDIKKAEYMTACIGQEFEASVSGVTNFGIFCELDNTVEGLIRLETLPFGPYVFYEKRHMLKGRVGSFSLGDRLRVRCIRANPELGHIDFELVR